MGWGDEAEAWLRSKMGEGDYERNVQRIRQEQAQYSKENPFTSGAAELAGGFIPGAAMMMVPGMQPTGIAQLGRSGLSALGKTALMGAGTGAVSGAGTSEEGSRLGGAVGGAALGGALGAALPVALRGAGAGARWLAERLAPTEARATSRAAELLNQTVARSQMQPSDITTRMAQDTALGVPSLVSNVSPRTAKLAQGVLKRSGAGAQEIEDALLAQKAGGRERVYGQVRSNLHPGDYYADEEALVADLRNRAKTMYDAAYAHGSVDDPRINTVLQHPEFASFFDKAQKIAKTEAMAAKLRGEDPSKYELQDLYKLVLDPQTGVLTPVVTRVPDVRTLDYMKRGIDATIDSGFRGQGMSTAEAQGLKQLRREFVNAIDENVPAYQTARKSYAGDLEVRNSMRLGLSDFTKLDHEEIAKMVAGMSNAEKEALRTGVARNIYGQIMKPANDADAAKRLLAPETQAKLQPLFDNPQQFDLFKNALERESQLFNQASRALGGSDTAENLALKSHLEESGQGFGDFVAQSVTGGFRNSLTNAALKAIGKTSMSDSVAAKLSGMLMAKDPHEVASVVKLLEDQAEKSVPQAYRAGIREAGVTSGVTSAFWPDQAVEEPAQPEDLSPNNQ
jgi:hypothetical protein